MKEGCLRGRREFLGRSAAAAAGIAAYGSLSCASDQKKEGVWAVGKQIHPAIDNLRVVSLYDATMIRTQPSNWSFRNQNDAVDAMRIKANVESLAKELTRKEDAVQAWKTIFRKPADKSWNTVRAAIKVNCINIQNMVRIPVVNAMCEALHTAGVEYANITVYDACHNAGDKYSVYVGKGLPAGVVVYNGKEAVSVPVGASRQRCTKLLVDSSGKYTIDILVNCAVNKGHGQVSNNGGATLTMKNHIGTMKFSCPDIDELIAINKSEAILGGEPVRQQLCIVDSLFASVTGPMSVPSHAPARLVMGTFGPAVDYLTVKKIREPVMNAINHDQALVQRYLTDFGYTEAQVLTLDMITVPPAKV
ncbi:MAG: DUF362 domain-containing protein [Chitinivibrionales bacterium]|nr:DUF362 domain-containing protein [Chitinivibrionales bacterium]